RTHRRHPATRAAAARRGPDCDHRTGGRPDDFPAWPGQQFGVKRRDRIRRRDTFPAAVDTEKPQMIRIENVSFQYRTTPILHGIDLTIPKGGVTALIGPNGAGKSSLLSLIARLLPLQTGSITIDGLCV